jgi:hypothetical protein
MSSWRSAVLTVVVVNVGEQCAGINTELSRRPAPGAAHLHTTVNAGLRPARCDD